MSTFYFYAIICHLDSWGLIHKWQASGAYPEIFQGGFFETFLYGRGVFGIFFMKNPPKLKINSQKGGPPKPSLKYTPDEH